MCCCHRHDEGVCEHSGPLVPWLGIYDSGAQLWGPFVGIQVTSVLRVGGGRRREAGGESQ